jgi:TolB-like protein
MRRALPLLAFGLLACASAETVQRATITSMTETMYARLAPNKKTSLAIVGFVPMGAAPLAHDPFSAFLVEELTLKLVNDGRVTVAERAQLEKVMQELKLESSGEVSDKSAKQLGELLGVDAILLGTYMDMGKEVKVNSRMIGTQDGQVMAASSVIFVKDKVIKKLLPRAPRAPKSRR